MRSIALPTTLGLLSLTILACSFGASEDIEGDTPGECTDGADNDADGYFDCEDNDCWGSPDCEESDTVTDGTDDTDDTDVDDDPVGQQWVGMEMTYTLDWEFTLPVTGLSDCTQIFEGDGDQMDVDGMGPHFDGVWELSSSDCEPALNDAIWTPGSGEAIHSVELGDDDGPWTAWWVHSGNVEEAEFGIYDFSVDLQSGYGVYQEDEAADAAVPGLILHHHIEIFLED